MPPISSTSHHAGGVDSSDGGAAKASSSKGRRSSHSATTTPRSDENNLQRTLQFLLSEQSVYYHHVMQPFYLLMLHLFRDKDENVSGFVVQCLPALLWHYLQVQAHQPSELGKTEVPDSVIRTIIQHAGLSPDPAAALPKANLQHGRAALEALILEMHNMLIYDSDGRPRRSQFTLPSLNVSSIYHDSSAFQADVVKWDRHMQQSPDLLGSGLSRMPSLVSRTIGIGARDRINDSNRWQIVTTLLRLFDEDLVSYSRFSLQALCEMSFKTATHGFPTAFFEHCSFPSAEGAAKGGGGGGLKPRSTGVDGKRGSFRLGQALKSGLQGAMQTVSDAAASVGVPIQSDNADHDAKHHHHHHERPRKRIHPPPEFFIELLYGLHVIVAHATASRKASGSGRDKDDQRSRGLQLQAGAAILALRQRSTFELQPLVLLQANVVYDMWSSCLLGEVFDASEFGLQGDAGAKIDIAKMSEQVNDESGKEHKSRKLLPKASSKDESKSSKVKSGSPFPASIQSIARKVVPGHHKHRDGADSIATTSSRSTGNLVRARYKAKTSSSSALQEVELGVLGGTSPAPPNPATSADGSDRFPNGRTEPPTNRRLSQLRQGQGASIDADDEEESSAASTGAAGTVQDDVLSTSTDGEASHFGASYQPLDDNSAPQTAGLDDDQLPLTSKAKIDITLPSIEDDDAESTSQFRFVDDARSTDVKSDLIAARSSAI